MTHARLLVQHCVPSPLANSFRCFPGGSGQRSGLARISFHRRFHFWLLPIPLIPLLQPCFWKDSRLDSFVTAHKNMGTFYLGCRVVNHRNPRESMIVPELPVDSGSEFTWIPSTLLEKIGVEPVKKDLQIQMANGQIVTRNVGYAILRVDKFETIDEVVFAQKGDLCLLGARALQGMNVHVDARRKRIVASGPVVAASATFR